MKTRKLCRAVHTGSKTPLYCRSTAPFVSMRSMPSIIRLSRRSFLAPPAKWSQRAISCVAVYSLVASRWSWTSSSGASTSTTARELCRAVHTGSKTPLYCRSTAPFVSMRSMPSIIRLSRRSFLAPPAKWSRRAISCVAAYSLVASRWSWTSSSGASTSTTARELCRAVHTGSKTPLYCRSTAPFVSMRSMPGIIRLSGRSFLAPPAKWSHIFSFKSLTPQAFDCGQAVSEYNKSVKLW